MNPAPTIAIAILLASALLSTVAHAQKTSAGYDKDASFSNYRTFAFDTHGARNPIVNQMIVAAVARELTSRGLTQVDANPHLLVIYLAASRFHLPGARVPFFTGVNTPYHGLGAGPSATILY